MACDGAHESRGSSTTAPAPRRGQKQRTGARATLAKSTTSVQGNDLRAATLGASSHSRIDLWIVAARTLGHCDALRVHAAASSASVLTVARTLVTSTSGGIIFAADSLRAICAGDFGARGGGEQDLGFRDRMEQRIRIARHRFAAGGRATRS